MKQANYMMKIAVVWIALITAASAQIGQTYFPADPANVRDWRAGLRNPSIGAFQTGAVEAGFKIFQLGFADNNADGLKATYAVANIPRRLPYKLSIGVQTQWFTTPLFQEGELRASISRQFQKSFAFGFSLGLRGNGYNSDNFDLVDLDDPVFADGTFRFQPDLGIGVTWLPDFAPMVVALTVNHLNRPAVSLLDDAIQLDRQISLGVSFNLNGYNVHAGGSRAADNFIPRGFVQFADDGVGLLQVGLEDQAAWLRGILHVRGPLSVGYGMSYPFGGLFGDSFGDHEASVIYEFDRLRTTSPLQPTPGDWDPFLPGMSRVDIVPQYYTASNAERIDIFEKQLVREIDETLELDKLAKLSRFDVGVLDSSLTEKEFPFALQSYGNDSTEIRNPEYTSAYLKSLRSLGKDLGESDAEVVLITPRNQKSRAAGLQEVIRSNLSESQADVDISQPLFNNPADSVLLNQPVRLNELPEQEDVVVISPGETVFTIYPLLEEGLDPNWRLVVENKAGDVVYSHQGDSSDQTDVVWNWRDQSGSIVAPGFYSYFVAWTDANGIERRSPARVIYARKLKRKIHIKVARRYQKPEGGVDKVGIILNK